MPIYANSVFKFLEPAFIGFVLLSSSICSRDFSLLSVIASSFSKLLILKCYHQLIFFLLIQINNNFFTSRRVCDLYLVNISTPFETICCFHHVLFLSIQHTLDLASKKIIFKSKTLALFAFSIVALTIFLFDLLLSLTFSGSIKMYIIIK